MFLEPKLVDFLCHLTFLGYLIHLDTLLRNLPAVFLDQEPCARGMVSNKFGSTSCVPCGVGEYQPLQANVVARLMLLPDPPGYTKFHVAEIVSQCSSSCPIRCLDVSCIVWLHKLLSCKMHFFHEDVTESTGLRYGLSFLLDLPIKDCDFS